VGDAHRLGREPPARYRAGPLEAHTPRLISTGRRCRLDAPRARALTARDAFRAV
jgi:hypothetical protein